MKMNPVIHFEMPYSDSKRLSKFYSEAFGWAMNDVGPKFGNYVLAATAESDDKGPKKPGAINGGFFPKGDYGTIPHIVISVDDLNQHLEIVKKAGGEILGKPMDIEGVGKFIMFKDSEGNRVGMLEPSR